MSPLDRIYEPSEDSDWEVAFRDSIRPTSISSIPTPTITSSTPAPSMTWRAEDIRDNMDHHQNLEYNHNLALYSEDNQPIELNENSQVIELQIPVISISSHSLEPLWSQEFISCSSPKYRSIPMYLAEGREDPEKDEGIDEPSSPLSSSQNSSIGPMVSGQATDQCSQEVSLDQPQPEDFIDSCDVLRWVINDSDIIPNAFVTTSLPAPATITSGAMGETMTRATTANFITPIKAEEPLAIPGPSFTLTPSPVVVKSELEDSDWEPDTRLVTPDLSRKRGRPAKPLGSRTITPRPPRPFTAADPYFSDSSVTMTDDEVSAQKYRRMRDLNNEASRRCREIRKERSDAAEKEIHNLRLRNMQLKRIVAKMEEKMKVMKRQILANVRNPPTSAAETQGGQGTNQGREGDFMESLLNGASADLPDLDTMWSRM
jgi:hypothetical protein